LSRVIVGLGQPNQTHINFRDSKLTRILQPSLSGNARMAVICCATPSEFYLEETRSTLLFASRAKLVKTRAQVNEVLDDRSLIKRLQRELAEARRASAGPGQLQHLKALEAEALNAGTAARDAEKKLDKLKSSILNHAVVFGAHPTASDANAGNSNQAMIPGIETKKRRLSDGAIMIDRAALQTPSRATTSQPVSSPLSVPHEHKKLKRTERKGPLSPSSELALVREAYNAKVEHAKGLEQRLLDMERKVSQGEESLLQASQTIREVESDRNAAIQESQHLSSEISSLFTEMQAAALRHDAAMKELSEKLESEQSSKTALEESLSILAKEIEQLKDDVCGAKEEALAESTKAADETSRLETIIQALSTEKSKFVGECEHLRASQDIANRKIFELETVNDELQEKTEAVTTSMEQSLQELNDKYETDVESLAAEKQILEQFVEQLEQDVKSSTDEIIDAHSRITDLKNEVEEKSKLVGTLTESVEETKTLLETSENEKSDLSMQLAETKTLIANATEEIQDLKADLENKVAINTELELQVVSLISKDEANAKAMQKLSNELEEATKMATFEQAEKERVQSLLDACTVERNEVQLRLDSVNKDLEQAKEAIRTSTETTEELESERDLLCANLNSQITSLESAKAEVEAKLVETRGDLESLCNEKQFLSEELEARRANEVALKDQLHDLTNEVEDKSAVVDKLTKSVEEINASLKTSANAKLDLSMQLAESKTAVENATKKIQDLKADLENKVAINTELELQVVSLTSKDEANAKAMQKLANELEEATKMATFEQAEKERVQSLLDACTVERNEVQLRLDSVNKDLEQAKEAIRTSTETTEELESERDLLCANLNSQITSLESAKAEVEAKLVETRGDLESLCNEKQFLSEELEAGRANEVALKDRLKDVHDSLSAALEEIDSLKASIVVLESQREDLNATFATFSADKASMESQVNALQSSKAEVDTKLAEAVDRLVALETEKQGLFDDILAHQANEEVQKEALRNMQALLEARQEEIDSLKSKISENEGERNQLGESLEATQAEKDKLKVQVISLEAAKSETEARLAKAVIQVDTLEAEKQEIYASIEAHDSNETKTANSLKEAQEQIRSLHAVIEDLQASENDAEHSKLMLQKVEAEATELKQLLAVANDSVREARDAALAAEDELEEKEREVQSLLQQLADSEENLRVATDKLSALDGQAGSSVNDELQQRIDELSNEIAAAKLELKNERSEQKIATEELKRQMAEEERALVNEAESRMAALNGRVVELTASLSTSEAEAYAARQELEDLQDQNKRLEDVALEVDMLRQSEKRLKDQVSSLSEARLELQSQLSQAKQQLESQSQDSDREVVETIAELNRVKNECFEAKQKGIDLSHQVEQLVQENSSSAREIRLFREKTAVLESSLSKLEDENQTLSSRLRDLEHTQSQQKDTAVQLVELDELNSRIRELESIIGKKDDRIAKLQKVKLTKTKVAEINKLRVSPYRIYTSSSLRYRF
jgi:chromosome segregation ATPase